MSKKIKWQFQDLIEVVVATLLNRFDFFMVVSGSRGNGKSTFAIRLAQGVSREFTYLYNFDPERINYYYHSMNLKELYTKKRFMEKIKMLKENKSYKFALRKQLYYTKAMTQRFLQEWNKTGILDEMINITFSRDFYEEKQKQIIKQINLNRDHENLIIACVPKFYTLDNQIRNLTKMHIFVPTRGVAIINTPNKTMILKDKWDTLVNEKIERKWIEKKSKNPNYSLVTTFRGYVRFKSLTTRQEQTYHKVKTEKRNTIAKEEMFIVDKKKNEGYEKVFQDFLHQRIKNPEVLEGIAKGMGLKYESLKRKLRKSLRSSGKPDNLKFYFWDSNFGQKSG